MLHVRAVLLPLFECIFEPVIFSYFTFTSVVISLLKMQGLSVVGESA